MSTANGHGTAVVVHAAPLAKAAGQMAWTAEQRTMIRNTFASGASESEFAVLLEVASARQLNPLLRQIHFVSRWDNKKSCNVWSTQAAIDGLRAIAQRTGLYAGQDEPEFVEEKGRIVACKVRVYRKDWTRPSVGVAYWAEYVQTTRDGSPTRFWQNMPHVMLAKCAEALALRKAFPEDMSGLYVPEEMGQAENVSPAYVEPAKTLLLHEPNPGTLFLMFSSRLDAASKVAEVNAVASGAGKAHKDGKITDDQLEAIKLAVTSKRAELAAPPPPPSNPEAGCESDDRDDADPATENC